MFILDGQPDEEILTFDVPDDALERAAAASDGQAVTIGYCTHWYHCNWPMIGRTIAIGDHGSVSNDYSPLPAAIVVLI